MSQCHSVTVARLAAAPNPKRFPKPVKSFSGGVSILAGTGTGIPAVSGFIKIYGINPIASFHEAVNDQQLRNNVIGTACVPTQPLGIGVGGKKDNAGAHNIDVDPLFVQPGADDLRLAFGTAAPVPIRCRLTEEKASDCSVSREMLAEIAETVWQDVHPRSSWRAAKDFRLQIISTLAERVVRQAILNAGGSVP